MNKTFTSELIELFVKCCDEEVPPPGPIDPPPNPK